MGSKSYQIILLFVTLGMILPGYSADPGTRGTGEEDPIPEEGPAPDGYYNLSMIDPLLTSEPKMIQMIDDNDTHHIAFSKIEIGIPSIIFYSKYSSDLESLIIWKKIVQGNYLIPYSMSHYLDNISIQFIEWRYNDQDGLYYPDLKMISIDENGDPVTGVTTLTVNISPPQTLEDLFHYPFTRRSDDSKPTRELTSSDGEMLYYIHGPMCNHGGTSTMRIIEKDRNGTLLREVPWIRFLAEGQFEQGSVCHDVLPLDWNQILDAPFSILLRVRYFAGFCYLLLKVNEDLEMEKFKVILPLEVTDVESLYEDRTSGTPTTGEMYKFSIGNISSDYLAQIVMVEAIQNGNWSSLVQLKGDETLEAEIEIPTWLQGTMAYRYHFIDPYGLTYISRWRYKTVIDNDPPELDVPYDIYYNDSSITIDLIPAIMENRSGFHLSINIEAKDNVGLRSVKVHYHFAHDDMIEKELLLTDDHERKVPNVPVPEAELRWDIWIPITPIKTLYVWFSVVDVTGLDETSRKLRYEFNDRIKPTLIRAENITVYVNESFEHSIIATDNWGRVRYIWDDGVISERNKMYGIYDEPGFYKIHVMVIDSSHNSIHVWFTVHVLPQPPFSPPIPTGVNINDPISINKSDPDKNTINSGYRPHYWGEPVIEEDEEGEENDKESRTSGDEIAMITFIIAFVLIASLIALIIAFMKKVQNDDLERFEE